MDQNKDTPAILINNVTVKLNKSEFSETPSTWNLIKVIASVLKAGIKVAISWDYLEKFLRYPAFF